MTVTKKLIGRLPVLIGEYDSTKVYNKKQRVTLYGSEFESKVDNNAIAPAILSNGTLTINTGNWIIVSNGTEAFLAGEKVKHFNEEDNPEFVSANIDNDGRLLESTDVDGKKTFYGDVNIKGNVNSKAIDSKINDVIEKAVENKIDKVDGKSLIDENIANSLSEEDNPEYMAVNLDVDNKVVDSTDIDGVVTHNTKHIFKNGIEDTTGGLKREALQYTIDNSSDLAKALKDGGYLFSATDWSDYISNDGDNPLHLPEPRCAIINLITADNIDLTKLNKAANLSKTDEGTRYNVPVEVQYWDKRGNYFKKKAYLSGQGDTSIIYDKKNMNLDYFDNDYGGDAFAVKIGRWLAFSSFHYKAFKSDFLRGSSVIAYKFATLVENHNGTLADKPWKRAMINADDISLTSEKESTLTDMNVQMDTGALCHPDGFPVIVYHNGSFWGIYSWMIKKHRDNYHMSKSNPLHIHLDGSLSDSSIWNGSISWSSFEIRNPKNLYYKESQTDKEGNQTYKYDADIKQAEIAGDDEVNAWIESGHLPDGTAITSKIKKNLQNTAKVKNAIIALSKRKAEIIAASTIEEKKALAEKYFDIQSFKDYEIVQLCVCDPDGLSIKNWQWITYDGIKWFVTEYDKDMSFGNTWTGMYYVPNWGMTGFDRGGGVFRTVLDLYQNDCLTELKSLIEDKIVSKDTLLNLVYDWIERIGFDNYKKEYDKWADSPCNRDSGVSKDWHRTTTVNVYNPWSSGTSYSNGDIVITSANKAYKSLINNNTATLADTASWEEISYVEGKTYSMGDKCYAVNYGTHLVFEFVAQKETTANPIAKTYTTFPSMLGYKDSLWRYVKFINTQIDSIIDWVSKQV